MCLQVVAKLDNNCPVWAEDINYELNPTTPSQLQIPQSPNYHQHTLYVCQRIVNEFSNHNRSISNKIFQLIMYLRKGILANAKSEELMYTMYKMYASFSSANIISSSQEYAQK